MIQEVPSMDEVDIEFLSPERLLGTHANATPFNNTVASARTYYGSRFLNQAMPIFMGQAPLVRAIDSLSGLDFDNVYGERLGARYAKEEGDVVDITPDEIVIKKPDGTTKSIDLYHNFQFNRKTQLDNRPIVKIGDKVKPGTLLAASNYTDDDGTLNMGLNARIAVVPYKGYSMDDAIVFSESFANKLKSEHSYAFDVPRDGGTKFGTNHFTSLFNEAFTKKQLENITEDGLVKPGTILKKGDPIILATRPKMLMANQSHLGKLSKMLTQIRTNSSQKWEHDYEGEVTDAVMTKEGPKIFVKALAPTTYGDKIALRNGQKGIVSKIVPDEQMLRSEDGEPYDVLLNPLGLPSRVNVATLFEIAAGKIAKKNRKPFRVTAFNDKKENVLARMERELKENDLTDTTTVFDPVLNKRLENPVSDGYGYILKLHHVVDSKISSRGNSSYDQDGQPLKGGSINAQAKRLGGLDNTALMANGAYAVMRDSSVTRGQQNDDYWRAVRQGYKPSEPGRAFVWDKFQALINGAGYHAKDIGSGKLRLGFLTNKEFDARSPIEVKSGKMVDPSSLANLKDGLFDDALVSTGRWGKITLPTKLPNPAAESQIQLLLGITNSQLRSIIAGEMTLEEAQNK